MLSETHTLSHAVGKMAFLRLFKPLHKFQLKMNGKPHTHSCVLVCMQIYSAAEGKVERGFCEEGPGARAGARTGA